MTIKSIANANASDGDGDGDGGCDGGCDGDCDGGGAYQSASIKGVRTREGK